MTVYNVQKGDTIASVTKRLNTTWEALRKHNPQSIGKAKNGNWFLKEGATVHTEPSFAKSLQKAQEVQSPQETQAPQHIVRTQEKRIALTTVPQTDPAPSLQGSQSSEKVTHTIQAGETLWELAVHKYNVSVEQIMRENNITDPKRLQIGQQIVIPAGKTPEYPETPTALAHHSPPASNERTCLTISRGNTFITISDTHCR